MSSRRSVRWFGQHDLPGFLHRASLRVDGYSSGSEQCPQLGWRDQRPGGFPNAAATTQSYLGRIVTTVPYGLTNSRLRAPHDRR